MGIGPVLKSHQSCPRAGSVHGDTLTLLRYAVLMLEEGEDLNQHRDLVYRSHPHFRNHAPNVQGRKD